MGEEDYGINNVVGGIVTMFSAFSGSMSASISRFITFELGKSNMDKLKAVFSTGITIQLGMSLLLILMNSKII